MKKINLIVLLGLIALMICSFAMAQRQLNQVWLVGSDYASSSATGSLWSTSSAVAFIDTANNIRGFGISTNEGKLIIANKGAPAPGLIYVVNTLDGQTTGNGFGGSGPLDTTGITGGLFLMDKAKVAADGAIYVVNLVTSLPVSQLKIYRWASTTAAISVAVSTTNIPNVPGARFGDGLGVAGSGTGTELYVGGSNSTCILKFTTSDGSTFNTISVITTQGIANGIGVGGNDIAPLGVNSTLWTAGNSNVQPTQLVDQNGLSIDSINTGVVASSWPGAAYFEAYGHKYMLKADGNIGAPFKGYIADITNGGASAYMLGTTAAFGTGTNVNGTSGVARDANNNLYFLIANNGFGKFTIPMSVSPTVIITQPGDSGTLLTALGGTGNYTWSVSPGHGSLDTTTGLSVTYSSGTTIGTDTVTVTDGASQIATTIVTITPTSAPLVPDSSELHGVIRSEPVWTFLE